MLGRWYKYFIILGVVGLSFPAYSAEYSSNAYRSRVPIQEEFGDYMQSVRNKISNTWTPPDVVESGHAVVIFKIDKKGNLINSYIKEGSGNLYYDEAALNSIKQASPYAEFPANASRDVITVVYSFDSSVVSTNHIKELVDQADKFVYKDNQRALDILNTAIKEIEGDPASYFIYARRHKIHKLMGDEEAAKADIAECKRLKKIYDNNRIQKCKDALRQEETPFAYFTLANAYDLAGDYNNAIYNIDKAISMTELNHAYKRYKAEIQMRKKD